MQRVALPFVLLTTLALLVVVPFARAALDHQADVDAVRAAVLDYVEGLYEVAPERIERSVHPKLAKLGWRRDRDGNYRERPLSYEQLVTAGSRYNQDGHVADDAPKEIEIYDVLDKVASAKLTAEWGIDYMHLAKLDGRWMIVNVLWQSHPPQD